jgi:signal transduction histidine kinase
VIRRFITGFIFSTAPLEEKAYGWVCLLVTTLVLLALLVNTVLGLDPALRILSYLGLAGYLPLYLMWRFLPHHPRYPFLLLLFSTLLLMIGWFPNGGIVGSIPFFYLTVLFLAGLLLKPRMLALFCGVCLLQILALTGIELQYPSLLTPYSSKFQQALDLFISFSFVGITSMFWMHKVHHAYQQERENALLANQVKSQFLSRMSHELRTPLNIIIGLTQQMRKKNLSPDRQALYLSRVEDNGLQLLELVNQLLDVSRIEAGRLDLDYRLCHLNTLLHTLVEQLEVTALNKGLQLRLCLPEQECSLQTDIARLRQILLNLLGNALKFTSSGAVTLRLEASPEAFLIHVEDTGPGISATQQQHLFEPFSRLAEAAGIEGSGLGLSIAHSLALHMNYQLRLEPSTVGTHFVLILPLTLASPA